MNTTPDTAHGATSGTESVPPAPAHPIYSAIATLLSAAIRLFPSIKPPNFAPPGALGLYGGARAPLWQALLMTLGAMAISDIGLKLILGYPWFNPWVYGGMVVYVVLGRLLLKKSRSAWRIGGASVLGGLLFFLITNFGVWASGIGKPNAMYPPTAAGLLTSYVKGLPFLGFTVVGDLGFAFVLFGAHAWLAHLAKGRERVPHGEAAK
jgi:hypothetical protein